MRSKNADRNPTAICRRKSREIAGLERLRSKINCMKPLAAFPPASSVCFGRENPFFDWATNTLPVRRMVARGATCGEVSQSSTRWTASQRDAHTANGWRKGNESVGYALQASGAINNT
ncbi:MAG: hypothetical protein LBU65_15180 [Planctomycetaceae bacterium]|nr:hypothetical protein [Planctomycetaceae bacterium]